MPLHSDEDKPRCNVRLVSLPPLSPRYTLATMGNMSSVMNTDPPKVHRNLCGLRYDNRFAFGATSARGITTTCFNDVVLEPLATWILLAILLPILAVVLMRSRHNTSKSSSTPLIRYRRTHQRWARLMVVLNIIYLLLVLAALLMSKFVRMKYVLR